MAAALTHLSLAEISEAIGRREVTSLEVTSACLERLEAVQPRIGCFIAVEADAALAAARAADAEIAAGRRRGKLHGVPVACKDIFDRRGRATTGGAKVYADRLATATATVIERLDAAGAVRLGTLNLDEFAAGATGDNPHFGRCRNPWNTGHIAGGSSGGAAAAVAARAVYAALGSDTGGSLRLPAACCGVSALKPTYGRVSRFGVFARARSFDSIGPAARTAQDCAIVLGAIAGRDGRDATTADLPVPDYAALRRADLGGLAIGVATRQFVTAGDPAILDRLAEAAKVFRELGARLVDIELAEIELMTDLHQIIVKCEAASLHGRVIRERPDDVSLATKSVIEEGFFIPAGRYIDALALRPALLAAFLDKTFAGLDAVMTPVLAAPVPTIAETDLAVAAAISRFFADVARALRFVNYLGLPALALPCGFAANGLPLGFQLVARPFHEATLFALGAAYQAATTWHTAAPPR
ncbi:MAG: amidase [Pseudomonadota bacterium]